MTREEFNRRVKRGEGCWEWTSEMSEEAPKGWKIRTRRMKDPDFEAYYAVIINPSGKVVTCVLNDSEDCEFATRQSAKLAGIKEANEYAKRS